MSKENHEISKNNNGSTESWVEKETKREKLERKKDAKPSILVHTEIG